MLESNEDGMKRILTEIPIKKKRLEMMPIHNELTLDIEWNGKQINDPSDKIIWTEKILNVNYCHIQLDDENILYAEIRQCINLLPIVIDEIKPVFGLNKLGTLWFKHAGYHYMLIKADIFPESREIIVRKKLKIFSISSLNENLINQIRKIFAFKEMLGITSNNESNILIIDQKAISCNEFSIKNGEHESCLSNTLIDKWFKNINLNDIIKEISKAYHADRVSSRAFIIYEKIVKIIEKIDRKLITFADIIKLRLLTMLQSCFKCNF